jgi:hypothetical protein
VKENNGIRIEREGKEISHPTCSSCNNLQQIPNHPDFSYCLVFDTQIFNSRAAVTYCNAHSEMKREIENG